MSTKEPSSKINAFDAKFDATISSLNVRDLESELAKVRAAEAAAEAKAAKPAPRATVGGTPIRAATHLVPRVTLSDAALSGVEEAASDHTVVLDSKQHAELMALRAQQDQALQKRFEKNVAVMFTDLVGSTAYYERYGDVKGREKVLTHNALLFPLITNSGGVIIKTIGDAIMACFDSVNDALAVATAMQHALAEHNRDIPENDDQIHIRIALNYGVAIAQDGDLYGDVVNVAARIEHEAPADEIYVSETVQQESTGWPFESVGAVSFKGKAGKTKLYRLVWRKVAKPEGARGPANLPARYKLGEMLSHGSIGDMFEGVDTETSRKVVIKGLHAFLGKDANARYAFRQAALNTSKLRHPGVVQVLDRSDDRATEPFFITERVTGTNLEQMVRRHGCPPAEYAALIGYRLAQIIAYAHSENVIHGDLKPENVLVAKDGSLRLIGFGLANVAASQVERTGSALGSPAFMSPEQVIGAPTDPRSDVYSLGALMYYLICGRPPYETSGSVQVTREVTSGGFTPIKRLNPDAPDRLVSLVGASLSIIADARPKDVSILALELARMFKEANLDPKQDLAHFMTKLWPTFSSAQIRSPDEMAPKAKPQPKADRSFHDAVTADLDDVRLDGPVDLEHDPRATGALGRGTSESRGRQVSLAMAVVGAVVIAGVSFALGWRMGQNQAREYFGNAAALQPVGSPLPSTPVEPLAVPEGQTQEGAPAPDAPDAPAAVP